MAARMSDLLAEDAKPSDPNREAPEQGGTAFYIPELEGAAMIVRYLLPGTAIHDFALGGMK